MVSNKVSTVSGLWDFAKIRVEKKPGEQTEEKRRKAQPFWLCNLKPQDLVSLVK